MPFNINTLKKITILYVEDDDMIRFQTADIFQSIFKHAHIAKDGHDAINKFLHHHKDIDLIISDINMPVMSGIELAEQIYAHEKDVPIIFTTAFNSDEYLEKAKDLGVAKFITKPIKIKDLMTHIASLVDSTKE
ncbi:MAG: response regulator [Campylobacterota bacterium]|nr:response regulator [Campylobacterota bacterium]